MVYNNLLVSVIIVTHNNENEIGECLDSIIKDSITRQSIYNFEIIVVDNASTDNTRLIVKDQFMKNSKQVRLVENLTNPGYAGGNNLGFNECNGSLIAILNPDLVVDENWLEELIKASERHPDAGILGSNVLLYNNRSEINACGNDVHFTGLVFARMYSDSECKCKEEYIAAPSGAAFMFRREILDKLKEAEPFDDFFIWDYPDIDLALKVLASGMNCVIVPSSKVYHKFKFKMSSERYFLLERGRYAILRHFTRLTRTLMLPALLLTELITWGFAFGKGGSYLLSKLKVYGWLLTAKNKKHLPRSKHKDFLLLQYMTPKIYLYKDILRETPVSAKNIDAVNSFYETIYNYLLNSLKSGFTPSRD